MEFCGRPHATTRCRPLAGAGSTSPRRRAADAAAANQNQAWGFTTGPLPDGVHNFTATSTDYAGNVSATSAALAITIDTVAPNAPVITGDTIVNTNHVLLSGTAEAGSKVALFEGVVQLGTATANGSGAWSFTTAALSNGTHGFTAKASDVAGNTSLASQSVSATIVTVIEFLRLDQPDPAWKHLLPWQRTRSLAEKRRGRRCSGFLRRLDADRRRTDGQRI